MWKGLAKGESRETVDYIVDEVVRFCAEAFRFCAEVECKEGPIELRILRIRSSGPVAEWLTNPRTNYDVYQLLWHPRGTCGCVAKKNLVAP